MPVRYAGNNVHIRYRHQPFATVARGDSSPSCPEL